MGIQVGTIFKWFDPDIEDGTDDGGESCKDGQCVGIVTSLPYRDESNRLDKPTVMVTWWQKCDLHGEIDPEGTGPYTLRFIWQIGLLY
jgi:hypothetical protein